MRAVGSARGASQFAGVLLHGRGKTPEEKIDLAARFGNIEGIRWVVPEAETPGSWYPGRFFDPRETNEPYLTESVERCHEAVLEAGEYGRLPPDRLVIVGFSQGASLALEYALRHPTRVGSLIVLTGGLMGVPGSDWKAIAPRIVSRLADVAHRQRRRRLDSRAVHARSCEFVSGTRGGRSTPDLPGTAAHRQRGRDRRGAHFSELDPDDGRCSPIDYAAVILALADARGSDAFEQSRHALAHADAIDYAAAILNRDREGARPLANARGSDAFEQSRHTLAYADAIDYAAAILNRDREGAGHWLTRVVQTRSSKVAMPCPTPMR